MTQVLRTSGAIDVETSVVSVDLEPFAVGQGLLSQLHRATLGYDGNPGPPTVIVKSPIDDPHQREVADNGLVYDMEVRFYTEMAASSGLRTPLVYAAVIADDSTDFVIVMEDLSRFRPGDQLSGATWEEALVCIDAMAMLHARWHEAPELEAFAAAFGTGRDAEYLDAIRTLFANGWPPLLQHAPELVPSEVIALGERFGSLVEPMSALIHQPLTLVHGDLKVDNVFFDGDTVIVIDFQLAMLAGGVVDLARFVGQSIEPSVRAGRGDDLIDRYVGALAAHGVERDRNEVAHQFKVALCLGLFYPVSTFPAFGEFSEGRRTLVRIMLERAVQAILDFEALDALPS